VKVFTTGHDDKHFARKPIFGSWETNISPLKCVEAPYLCWALFLKAKKCYWRWIWSRQQGTVYFWPEHVVQYIIVQLYKSVKFVALKIISTNGRFVQPFHNWIGSDIDAGVIASYKIVEASATYDEIKAENTGELESSRFQFSRFESRNTFYSCNSAKVTITISFGEEEKNLFDSNC